MFGGLFKLLFLAGVVAGAWYLFKMLAGPSAPTAAPDRPAQGQRAARNRLEAEDMIACKICGTYVAAKGARSCGRADCPWRG